MKIAVTIWGNRISPVFDAAKMLLIAEVSGRKIQNKTYHTFSPQSLQELITFFKDNDIRMLVCGAISSQPAEQIIKNDIRLISFVMGNAMEFLDSFKGKSQIDPNFVMPGCTEKHAAANSHQ